jgi:hypothetical protein
MAMVEKATVGSVGFTGLVAVLCIYGIIVGFLRVIQRTYMSRQARLAAQSLETEHLSRLVRDIVEELEIDGDEIEVEFK